MNIKLTAHSIAGVFLILLFSEVTTAEPPSSKPPARPLDNISEQMEVLETKIDRVLGSMMVPFRTTIEGGLCDSGTSPASNPVINISGELADATFVVNSILIQTEEFTEPNRLFAVNGIRINGLLYETTSELIFDTLSNIPPADGASPPGFDIMGLKLAESPNWGTPGEGGVFPTQIVANSTNSIDIQVQLFCRSDDTDWNISRISVAGMKQVDDVISVSYTPGQ